MDRNILLGISALALASSGGIALAQEAYPYFRLHTTSPVFLAPPGGGVNTNEDDLVITATGMQARAGTPVYAEILVGNGYSPYTVEATGFPIGVNFDSTTRLATGTAPATATVHTISVSAVDSAGTPGTQTFDFEVLPQLAFNIAGLEEIVPNGDGSISFIPSVDGLISPSFSFGSGFVPPSWLHIDPNNGRVHGMPPTGTYELTGVVIVVEDDLAPAVSSNAFTLKFGEAPSNDAFAGIYGVDGSQFIQDLALSSTGELYLVGSSGYDSNSDLLVRLSSTAEHQWTRRTLEGNKTTTRDLDLDATAVYAVGFVSAGAGNFDSYLVKYGLDGSLIYRKTWDTDGRANQGYHVAVSDGVYVGGTHTPATGGNLAALSKFDLDGNEVWTKHIPLLSGYGTIKKLVAAPGGGVLAILYRTPPSGQGVSDVVSVDADGTILSYRTLALGNGNSLYIDQMDIASDGSLLLSGYETGTNVSGRNNIGMRLSGSNVSWSKRFNAAWNIGLAQLQSGDAMIVGSDGKYARLDSSGNVLWGGSLDSVNGYSTTIVDMDANENGLYLAGYASVPATGWDTMSIVLPTSGLPVDDDIVVSAYTMPSSDIAVTVSSQQGVVAPDLAFTATDLAGSKTHITTEMPGEYFSSLD